MDVDFTSVDVSTSFKVCDSLIDKDKKNSCFRSTIREEIANSLAKYSIFLFFSNEIYSQEVKEIKRHINKK